MKWDHFLTETRLLITHLYEHPTSKIVQIREIVIFLQLLKIRWLISVYCDTTYGDVNR